MSRIVHAGCIGLALAFGTPASAETVADLFKAQDLDRNDELSESEARAGLAREFAVQDLDHDGRLDQDEIATHIARSSKHPIPGTVLASVSANTLGTWDANRDGEVGLKEFQDVGVRLLMLADGDGNGSVSRPELKRFRHEP